VEEGFRAYGCLEEASFRMAFGVSGMDKGDDPDGRIHGAKSREYYPVKPIISEFVS
jgi:hypothetical protein